MWFGIITVWPACCWNECFVKNTLNESCFDTTVDSCEPSLKSGRTHPTIENSSISRVSTVSSIVRISPSSRSIISRSTSISCSKSSNLVSWTFVGIIGASFAATTLEIDCLPSKFSCSLTVITADLLAVSSVNGPVMNKPLPLSTLLQDRLPVDIISSTEHPG